MGIPVTICKSYELRLTNSWGFNSSCFEARLFWKNQINIMAADALANETILSLISLNGQCH